MRNVNLTVKSLTGKEPKNVGKCVMYRGKPVFGQFVQGRWKRRDLDAWGINSAVLDYLEKQGAQDLFLYDMAGDRTYCSYVGILRQYGTPSDRHDWGENLNLPLEEWSVLPGKVNLPWVAANCAVMLHPKPLIVREEVPAKEPEDAIQQAQLFA